MPGSNIRCKDGDDDHTGGAVRTDNGGRRAIDRRASFYGSRTSRYRQQLAHAREIGLAAGIGEQALLMDAVKAVRQHTQQESAQEFVAGMRHGLQYVPCGSFPRAKKIGCSVGPGWVPGTLVSCRVFLPPAGCTTLPSAIALSMYCSALAKTQRRGYISSRCGFGSSEADVCGQSVAIRRASPCQRHLILSADERLPMDARFCLEKGPPRWPHSRCAMAAASTLCDGAQRPSRRCLSAAAPTKLAPARCPHQP